MLLKYINQSLIKQIYSPDFFPVKLHVPHLQKYFTWIFFISGNRSYAWKSCVKYFFQTPIFSYTNKLSALPVTCQHKHVDIEQNTCTILCKLVEQSLYDDHKQISLLCVRNWCKLVRAIQTQRALVFSNMCHNKRGINWNTWHPPPPPPPSNSTTPHSLGFGQSKNIPELIFLATFCNVVLNAGNVIIILPFVRFRGVKRHSLNRKYC